MPEGLWEGVGDGLAKNLYTHPHPPTPTHIYIYAIYSKYLGIT